MQRNETIIEDRFEPIPNSRNGRVRCKLCGREGYPVDGGWRATCSRDHLPCPKCGHVLAVKMDGTPHIHARCPRK
jgi:hypothetical protein